MSDRAADWEMGARPRASDSAGSLNDWVVLKKTDQMEAEVLRAALETADIPVAMRSEAVGRIIGVTNTELGQVTLLVPRDREQEARDLIDTAVAIDFPESD